MNKDKATGQRKPISSRLPALQQAIAEALPNDHQVLKAEPATADVKELGELLDQLLHR